MKIQKGYNGHPDLNGFIDHLIEQEDVEKSTTKKSRIEFQAHSYMSITAVEYGKDDEDYPDEEPPNFFIDWDNDPKMFAKTLREGATFLDQYKDNHKITINID